MALRTVELDPRRIPHTLWSRTYSVTSNRAANHPIVSWASFLGDEFDYSEPSPFGDLAATYVQIRRPRGSKMLVLGWYDLLLSVSANFLTKPQFDPTNNQEQQLQ